MKKKKLKEGKSRKMCDEEPGGVGIGKKRTEVEAEVWISQKDREEWKRKGRKEWRKE